MKLLDRFVLLLDGDTTGGALTGEQRRELRRHEFHDCGDACPICSLQPVQPGQPTTREEVR